MLVAPASLLANWAAEIERFAAMLRFLIAHPSASGAADLKEMKSETLADVDLVITATAPCCAMTGYRFYL